MSNVDFENRKLQFLLEQRKKAQTREERIAVELMLRSVRVSTSQAGGGARKPAQPAAPKSSNRGYYEAIQGKVGDANTIKAYALTGLDSASRRSDSLTQLDQLSRELQKWAWLGKTPAEMEAAVYQAYQKLLASMGTIDNWSKRMAEIAAEIPKIPSDPGFAAPDTSDAAQSLAKQILAIDRDLKSATDEINAAKTQIGEIWKSITGTTKTLVHEIETEVKRAVARMHNEAIEGIQLVQTVSSRVLGIIGLVDPTLIAELSLKGLAVAIEAAAEAAKLAAERVKASKTTMDEAMGEYDEWDIPMASAERWKGAVKVAIHTAIIPIPKSDLLSPFLDGIVEVYFDAAIVDGKALQKKQKEGGPVEESVETWWESLKDNLIEEFMPENLTDASNTWLGAVTVQLGDGEGAKGIGAEILGKLSKAVISVLREKLLPVKPEQPVPALDIRSKLDDLDAVYTKALTRPMDAALKAEFESALQAANA
jgi:hypothetical protein